MPTAYIFFSIHALIIPTGRVMTVEYAGRNEVVFPKYLFCSEAIYIQFLNTYLEWSPPFSVGPESAG